MDKADLETLLYTRAACAGVEVHARNGRLYCVTPDKVLQRLLNVYNRFFEEENRKFLKRDIRLNQQAQEEFFAVFDKEARRLGPCARSKAVCIPLYKHKPKCGIL